MAKESTLITSTEKELKVLDGAISRIRTNMENIAKGYIVIAGDIKRLNDEKAWEMYEGLDGYADSYNGLSAFTRDMFGMSQATTAKLLKIATEFYDENYKLKSEWNGYSMTALYAIAQIPSKERECIEFKPEMTLKEIDAISPVKSVPRARKDGASPAQPSPEHPSPAQPSTDQIITDQPVSAQELTEEEDIFIQMADLATVLNSRRKHFPDELQRCFDEILIYIHEEYLE